MERASHVHAEHGRDFGVWSRRPRIGVQVAVQYLGYYVVRRLPHVVVARVASCRVIDSERAIGSAVRLLELGHHLAQAMHGLERERVVERSSHPSERTVATEAVEPCALRQLQESRL